MSVYSIKPPDRIYLQWTGEDGVDPDTLTVPPAEVTWCDDQINDSDVEYVRVTKKRKSSKRLGIGE